MIKKLIPILLFLAVSCKMEVSDNAPKENESIKVFTSILDCLQNESKDSQSFEFEQNSPLCCYYSGNILNESEIHSVYVEEKDSLYSFQVYKKEADNWILVDRIDSLKLFPVQFDLEFIDFNFDGMNDFFIQQTCSNGITMKRGYLIEFGSKLIIHKEVCDLANFRVNKDSTYLLGETLIDCEFPNGTATAIIYLENKNGELVEIKRDSLCNLNL